MDRNVDTALTLFYIALVLYFVVIAWYSG